MTTSLSSQYLIACSDENIDSGAILSFDAVCTGSPVVNDSNEMNKQV